MNETTSKKRHYGFKRWLVLALIIVQIVIAGYVSPISPAVSLAPERITPAVQLPVVGSLALSNTIVDVLIVDVLLILAALAVSKAYTTPETVPGGIAGTLETLVEYLYNLSVSVAGNKWAKKIFPLMGTIFLLVFMVNLTKLIPGVESIGLIEKVEGEGKAGYAVQKVGPLDFLVKPDTAEEGREDATGEETGYMVVPFVRPASTDLNFTLAVALSTMIFVQFMGFQAGGFGYLNKFLNFRNFLKMWVKENLGAFDIVLPLIDIFVGFLELIAEIGRIISFSFRLLGSMFAGAILLFVMGSLFLVLQAAFLFLELFFAVIQAFVFSMLSLVFSTMATLTHGSGEDHEGHEAHEAA